MVSLSVNKFAMRFKFTTRAYFLFVIAVALVLTVGIGHAERQRKSIAVIEKNGGIVVYSGEPLLPWSNPIPRSRSQSLIHNLRFSVTGVQISFYGYNDETKDALAGLPNLRTIHVTGHDTEFGVLIIQEDFPNLQIVNLIDAIKSSLH